jgi:MFS family permease
MKKVINRKKLSPKGIVYLLGFGTAISLLGESSLYIVLPIAHFASQLGVTMTMVGIILGTNRGTRLFTNGPVGYLYERMNRRPLLIAALCLAALASLIYTLGFGFWPLFFGRVTWGIAWSLLWIGSKTVILEISDESNRGTFNGIYQMFFLAGIGFASLFGGVVADLVSFHFGQRLAVGVILTMAFVLYLFLPETKIKLKKPDDPEKEKAVESLKWNVIVPSSITIFITRFIERGVLAATASLWINTLFGGNVHLFGFLLPAATLAGLFNAVKLLPGVSSAPLIGFISDKLKKRWIVITFALILCGVGLWLMSIETVVIALIGVLLASLFGGSSETLIPAIIGDEVGQRTSGRTMGIIYTIADLGSTLGPFISLAILDSKILTISEVYIACIGLVLIAAITTFIASRKESSKVSKREIQKMPTIEVKE